VQQLSRKPSQTVTDNQTPLKHQSS